MIWLVQSWVLVKVGVFVRSGSRKRCDGGKRTRFFKVFVLCRRITGSAR